MLPTVNPGTAPAATVGADVLLTGTTANATTSTWSLVSGPGVVWFSNASSPTSTFKFSAPGTYTLQLTAANAHGQSSRTLSLIVTGTAMTPIESWRQTHFNNHTNTGTAADTFDANGDGEANLLEFATGQNPNGNTLAAISASLNGANLEFTYTRANAALADGVTFTVEWSYTLAPGSWTSIGVTEQILTNNGTVQTVKATIPAGTPMCFARLKVTTAP
jgi:PKD repeat protein